MADVPASLSALEAELAQFETAAAGYAAPLAAEIKTDVSTALPPIETEIAAKNYPAAEQAIGALAQKIATDVIDYVTCFTTGALIRCVRDGAEVDVAVERLAIGDTVVTASGAHRPVRWIGTRSYAARFVRNNPALLPIRFQAGCLADGVPARDLRVSPKHALFLDGVLIPAECLVNGATIIKEDEAHDFTYWHVELDSHDVLVAEGAPAESYLDDHNRGIFHNAHSFQALYPDACRTEPAYCAPRVEHGYALQRVRRRLAERAGLPLAAPRQLGALRGRVEGFEAGEHDEVRVWGWAQSLAYPDAPVCLEVLVDGAVVALGYAKAYRADLAAAGIGDGRHAFDVALPPALPGGAAVTVRRAADGAMLGGMSEVARVA